MNPKVKTTPKNVDEANWALYHSKMNLPQAADLGLELCYDSGNTRRILIMRCKVQLYVAGKVFYEEVEVRNYQEARETALARNPNAKVMGVTAI